MTDIDLIDKTNAKPFEQAGIEDCPRLKIEFPSTAFRTETPNPDVTCTFNPMRVMVMRDPYTCKGQDQRSLDSKVKSIETVEQTDRGDCITSCDNAVGKYASVAVGV